MKPTATHAAEDRLLEYAYGELSPGEAAAVEGHLQGCVKCAGTLDAIRGVRRAMSPLAEERAPEAGLESLLAYAEQSARRTREAHPPRRPLWRRWMVGLATASALALVVGVARRAQHAPEAAREALSLQGQSQVAEARKKEAAPPPALAQWAPSAAPSAQPSDALADLSGAGGLTAAEKDAARPLPSRRKAEAAAEVLRKGDLDARAGWEEEAPAKEAPQKLALLEKKKAPRKMGSELFGNAMDGPPVSTKALPEAPAEAAAPAPEPPVAVASQLPGADAEEAERGLSLKTSRARSSAPGTSGRAESALVEKYAELARMRASRGDRAGEAEALRKALAQGAVGGLREDLLGRLCLAEVALGRRAEAEAVCAGLLREVPDSSLARAALERLRTGAAPTVPASR